MRLGFQLRWGEKGEKKNCTLSFTDLKFLQFCKCSYYMTSSMSRQDGPNLALWFATQVGKIELSCLHGIRLCPARKIYHVLVFYPNNKSFIDHACSVKMAVYRPIFFMCVCLWTSTLSWSINTQKNNLADIQPSWPHTWSITPI